MSSGFCPDITAITDSDLYRSYGSSTLPGILSLDSYSALQRDPNDLIIKDSLISYINALRSKGIVPTPPPNGKAGETADKDTTKYVDADDIFVQRVRDEFCYYNARYKFALKKLITKLTDSYNQPTSDNATVITGLLESTKNLNRKLNDMIQITNMLTYMRLDQAQSYNEVITQLNDELGKRSDLLKQQSKMLNSQQATIMLNKEMIKYTEEKSSSVNNLLQMYSFLNIFAVGLLIYIYRSAGE
jgi:hypothetical protein